MISLPIKRLLICPFLICFTFVATATEEVDFDYPLGPIGGKFRILTGNNLIRLTEIIPNAPGAAAGLKVDDFIYGAFDREFDPMGKYFHGIVRQLGACIDHAEANDGKLPLMIQRPGEGNISVTVNLPILGALSPAYPLTSAKYASAYDWACDALHRRVMDGKDGDLGYPTGFTGLTLLAHPSWKDTTGAKPYRLSVDKIRDYFVGRIEDAIYAPVEDLLLDHEINKSGKPSSNPHYENVGLESWTLGQAVMFLAEYKAKTGDASLMPILQRGAELMANRIQWWRQPPQHENGYAPGWNDGIAGMTGHGGVVGDYIHSGWGGGINMVGAHLFCGLGLAKRAGVDMSVRPRDGHYFGYDLHPGDNIPPEIATALPASIDLPRGCEDPITGASKIQNPFWYDMTLDQKFWLHWDCITRSTGQEGNVGYHFATSYSTEDAGGRTPSALFGFLAYTGKDKLSETDQKLLDKKKEYIILQHDRHLQAHAYNMGGSMFMALSLPYLSDRDQRYFLDNWKFFYNLSRQPDGSLSYVRGRDYGDAYQDYSLVALLNTALPRSIAIGGLPHVPGYETNRIFARFRQPLLEWPTPEARQITLKDSLITKFEVDLLHAGGETLDSNQITAQWSVLSGPATVNIFTTPESLSTMAQFSGPGIYRLQLVAKIGHLNTTEVIDVFIPPSLPDDWEAGVANYEIYENIAGTAISDLTSATNFPDSPDKVRTLSSLEGDQRIVRGGSRISGYLIPPATGKFVFHVASDDASELRLNPTPSNGDFVDDEAGLALIASVPNWTDARQWGKYAEQQSDPIHLEQGKRYRFEALQKENGGADHISIGWTLPNVSKIEIIGVTSLAIPLQTERSPAIVKQPINQAVALGDKVAFTLLTEGPAPALYQWRLDGVNYLTPTVDPTLTINNVGAGHVGVYDCVYTAGDQVLISQTAALKITNPEFGATKSGGLWQEVWEGIRGGAITDLTSDSSFPRFSDASSLLTGAETSSLGDKYGQRWTGWITPDETADYRFYVTSDDACELRLSNDQTQANLDLISSRKTWCNARAWETVTPSDWLPLVAGQRYYLEMLHKEGGGGDHCAITWQKSGAADPINGDPPIDGAFLSCRFGGPPNVQKSSQAVTIEVSGGVFSDPFYTFTIDGTLLDRLNGSHFKAGSAYEFKAKGISLNHPFTVGVSRDSTHSWITGGALTGSEGLIRVEIPEDYQGSITYYCTAHTSMTKAFKVGEADVDAFTVSGKVTMLGAETSTPLAGVTLRLNQDGSESDTMSDVDGKYSFNLASGAGIELTAGRAHGEGASTGVDVVDIVEMRKHILGRTPFGTLRKVIAGDTNRDASVDVVDIVNVRNVILGRNDYFSEDSGGNKESYWRFVDGDYLSVGVVNAFSELPKYESIIFSSLESDVSGADFTGIKLGDVNGDWYDANSTTLFSQNTMNSRGLLSLSASRVSYDGTVSVDLNANTSEELLGMQFKLNWDGQVLRLKEIEDHQLRSYSQQIHSHRQHGSVQVAWDDALLSGVDVAGNKAVMTVHFTQQPEADRGTNIQLTHPLLVGSEGSQKATMGAASYYHPKGGLMLSSQGLIRSLHRSEDGLSIEFETRNGMSYVVERAYDLGSGQWEAITTIKGSGRQEVFDIPKTKQAEAYLRVREVNGAVE